MLTEHAKTVHAKFINEIKHLGDSLCNFLLKLVHDFKDIIITKHSIHPDDNLSHYQEDIFFYLDINSFE